jgi:hypothetical protein
MVKNRRSAVKGALNEQRAQWETIFSLHPNMFGVSPNEAARKAVEVFRQANKVSILELGAGQGRDSLYFAQRDFKVCALCIYTVRHTGDVHYRTGIHRGEDMYEVGGFIVHFFDRGKVEHLAEGYEILEIEEFEEGGMPRRLFRVTMKKA